jgi:hypothetical protein
VELLPAPITYVLDDIGGSVEKVAGWETSPLMVWRKRLLGRRTLLAYAYLGRTMGTPKPTMEVPALLFASTKEILRRNTPTIREVLDEAGSLVEASAIPRKAVLRPWGTPVYLRRLMTRQAFDPIRALV